MKRKLKIFGALKPIAFAIIASNLASITVAQTLNPLLQGIVTPSSTQRWITFNDEGSNLQATQLFETYKNGFGLSNADQMRLVEAESDEIGMQHYNFKQYHNNYAVMHGEFKVHQAATGNLSSANGRIISGISGSVNQVLTEAQALQKALQFMGAKKYLWQNEVSENELKRVEENAAATYYPKGELQYTPNNFDGTFRGEDYRLGWTFKIYTDDIKVPAKCITVDVVTGAVNYYYDISMSCATGSGTTAWQGSRTLHTQLSGGSYRSHNDCQTTDLIVYNCNGAGQSNTYYTDANNAWTATTQQSAAQAQFGIEGTYHYFNGTHARQSWNGSSGDMIAYNNAFAGSNNACWGCTGNSTIYYAGNTSAATDDWNTVDIMGHEFAHGVTQDEAGLIYNKESGALNESFSDIFGEMVESYNLSINDWLVGADRGAIRSFINPNSYGDPDTYNGTNYKTTVGCTPSSGNDQCGVHSNSSIQNRMFYLLSEGGTGTTDFGVAYNVSGITRFTARIIGYRALVFYLSGSDGFIDAREAWLRAAFDLYGGCSNEIIQVGNAWRAVGVESQSAQYNVNACGTYPASGTSRQAINQLSAANGCATTITASASTVYFSATNRVVLYPGFTAVSGSKFYAYIEPCAISLYKTALADTRSPAEKGLFVDAESLGEVSNERLINTSNGINVAPNPFSNEVNVQLKFTETTQVSVALYDALGNVVANIVTNEMYAAGSQQIKFDSQHLAKGIYLMHVVVNGETNVRKIVKM